MLLHHSHSAAVATVPITPPSDQSLIRVILELPPREDIDVHRDCRMISLLETVPGTESATIFPGRELVIKLLCNRVTLSQLIGILNSAGL